MKKLMAWMAWTTLGWPLLLGAQIYIQPGLGPRLGSQDDLLPDQRQTAYEIELTALRKQAVRLARNAKPAGAVAAPALAGIQTNALFLQVRWRDWAKQNPSYGTGSQPNVPDAYLRSLGRDNELLRRAAREKSPGAARELIESVALDLQAKADHCRNSAEGLGKVVQVKVRTKKAGAEVSGLEVWFVQKGLFDVPGAHDRFRLQSSPTEGRDLWPGGYAMWVQRGGTNAPPTTVRVGGRGEKEIVVDLEVP